MKRLPTKLWLAAVFGKLEFRSARRAQENSPAIYRWETVNPGKVPQGRQNTLARTRRSKKGFLSSLRDSHGLGRWSSDESLGYFRSSLRDFNLLLFLVPAGLATTSIYSTENGEELKFS
jgi:hypothetical protein